MPLTTPAQYLRNRTSATRNQKPTLATILTTFAPSTGINTQTTSPLFSLPSELRQIIFTYALLSYPDLKSPHPHDPSTSRPGFTHVNRITVSLLLTCRRIYLETVLLPLEINEHVVYGCGGGHHRHGPGNYIPYLFPPASRSLIPGGDKISILSAGKGPGEGMLKQEQRDAVKRVRVFAQQYWLEDFNGRRGGWSDFCRSWAPLRESSSRRQGKSSTGQDEQRRRRSGGGKGRATKSNADEVPVEEARKGGLEELNVTIRHRDWWHYLLGPHSPMALDPFKAGRPTERASPYLHGPPSYADTTTSSPPSMSPESSNSLLSSPPPSAPSPHTQGKPSHLTGWATHLRHFTTLRTFELELETLDEPDKRSQLDEIASVAPSWRFPLGGNNDRVLVFDEEATRRSFWKLDPPKSANKWGHLDPNAADEPSPSRSSDKKKLRRRRKAAREREGTSRSDGTRAASASAGSGAWGEAEEVPVVRYYVVLLVWRAQKVEIKDGKDARLSASSTNGDINGSGTIMERIRTGSQVDGGSLSASTTTTLGASRTASTASVNGSTAANPTHPAAATGTARAVGRDVIPSYWG